MKTTEIKAFQLQVIAHIFSYKGLSWDLLEEYKTTKDFFASKVLEFEQRDKKELSDNFKIIDDVIKLPVTDNDSKVKKIFKIKDKLMIEAIIKVFQLEMIALGFKEVSETEMNYYQNMKEIFISKKESKLLEQKQEELLENFKIIDNFLKIPAEDTHHKLDELFKIQDTIMVKTLTDELGFKNNSSAEIQALLIAAVIKNLPNLAKYALVSKADPNIPYDIPDESENLYLTLLHLAASKGHREILELLIENHGNPNVVVEEKVIVSFSSIWTGVRNFFTGDQPSKTKSKFLGYSCWHIAALKGDVETLEVLLRCSRGKEYINSVTMPGKLSPLCVAVQYGKVKAIDFLIKNKAKFHKNNSYDFFPLYLAMEHNQIKVIEYFFEKYPDYREQFLLQPVAKELRQKIIVMINEDEEKYKEVKELLNNGIVEEPAKNSKNTKQTFVKQTRTEVNQTEVIFFDNQSEEDGNSNYPKKTTPNSRKEPKSKWRGAFSELGKTEKQARKNNKTKKDKNSNCIPRAKTGKQNSHSQSSQPHENRILLWRTIGHKQEVAAKKLEEERRERREEIIKEAQAASVASKLSSLETCSQISATSKIIEQSRAEIPAEIKNNIYILKKEVLNKKGRPAIWVATRGNGILVLVGSSKAPINPNYRYITFKIENSKGYEVANFSKFFWILKDDIGEKLDTTVRVLKDDKIFISEKLVSLDVLQELFPDRMIKESSQTKEENNISLLNEEPSENLIIKSLNQPLLDEQPLRTSESLKVEKLLAVEEIVYQKSQFLEQHEEASCSQPF